MDGIRVCTAVWIDNETEQLKAKYETISVKNGKLCSGDMFVGCN